MPKINYHAKLLPNQCYHIYNHAVGRENLFKKPRNYIYFWSKWQQYISPYFANYACCLMLNHFHVLCKALPITAAIQQHIEAEAEISNTNILRIGRQKRSPISKKITLFVG